MKKVYLVLIFVFGFIAVFDLFHAGFAVTHDGQDHVARIANFYQGLSEGIIIPRWAVNLNWGYGHPILEFLYPLPSYIASLFHFFGFTLIDSTKIVFGLGIILSGIFMYLWLLEFLGIMAAFVGAVLYMYAPYRFVEVYVRGDIGENLAFVFIPACLYFILKLSKSIELKWLAGGAISLALLILSHNAISLMFMPFIIFYGLFCLVYLKKKKEYLFNFITLVLLGFGLSAFFWIPGLLEAKYTLRNIVTAGEYMHRFVDFSALIYGPWSYGGSGQFTIQLGVFQWISLILSPFILLFFWKKNKKEHMLSLSLLIFTALAIFIMLPQSGFIWQRFIILQNFQFPWRFLAITVFSTAVLAALVFDKIAASLQKAAVVLVVIVILFLSKDYWRASEYAYKPESFFTGIYNSTTDTGESAPVWSVRFMEKRPKSHVEVIGGSAVVKQLIRTSTRHSYEITAFNNAQLRENTVYFPGWEVFVDQKPTVIEFQSQKNRGVMTFFVSEGKHLVDVLFTETRLRLVSDLISAASFIILLSYNIWSVRLWRRFL